MTDKNNCITGTYPISRDESGAIKGLVILLIVIGHCKGIVENPKNIYFWLYSFHVQQFFILPWLYPFKNKSTKDVFITSAIRMVIPYVIFYTFSYFVFNLVMSSGGEKPDFFNAFFSVDADKIGKTVGIQAIWFLPVFFVYTIVIHYIRKYSKYSLIVLMIMILAYIINKYTLITDGTEINGWIKKLSLCISCSIITCYVLKLNRSFVFSVALIIFTTLTIILFIDYDFVKEHLRFLTIISAFIIIYYCRKFLAKSKLLIALGKYSLPIYLIHIYVVKFCELRWGTESVGRGIATFYIAVLSAWILSVIIYKIKLLRKLIFPNSVDDIKSLFCRNKENNIKK